MSASTRVVGCPLCGTPVEVPDGSSRVACGICSSAIVFQDDGEPILESDLERQKRRQGDTVVDQTSPDVIGLQTSPDVIGLQTSPDVIELQTSPDVPIAPDVPIEQQTSPGVPIEQQISAAAPPHVEAAPGSPLDAHAFQGLLKNLSIVDVLQLLYSSQKTGVLELTGAEVTASITLLEGQIIGCEHPTQGTQIGKTLVETGTVTEQDVEEALAKQRCAGDNRLPLVSTLIAMGKIEQQAGWQALEKLVESTVVHVLGWIGGTFVFEVADVTAFDDFRHLATGVTKVGLDTQTTLLETLKVIDERNRGGPANTDDTTLLDNLDAAFAEPATAAEQVAATEVLVVADDEVEEIHDTEEISVALAQRTAPIAQVIERLRRVPPKILAAAGGGVLALIILIIVIIVSLSGPEPEPSEPITTEVDGATAERPRPADTEPGSEPQTEAEAEAEAEAGAEPVVAPRDATGAKVKRPKRKRKVKRKGKDARSLFDAAVK